MNPLDPALFAAGAPCMPCCINPIVCACTYDFSKDSPAQIGLCRVVGYAFHSGTVYGLDAFSVTDGGSSLDISATSNAAPVPVYDLLSIIFDFGITIGAGTFSMGFDFSFLNVTDGEGDATVSIAHCNGDPATFIVTCPDDPPCPNDGTISAPLPAGEYFVHVEASASGSDIGPTSSFSVDLSFSDSGGYVTDPLGPAAALCNPRMFLPPLTESSGDWYADFSAASAAIAAFVSNCVGYCAAFTTFTATDGGSSLTLDGTTVIVPFDVWSCVNAGAGDILSAAFSTSGTFSIYDYAGNFLFSGTGSTVNSTALPYFGRYIIFTSHDWAVTEHVVVTSSGLFSVNKIEALYDMGLVCPGRLDCT